MKDGACGSRRPSKPSPRRLPVSRRRRYGRRWPGSCRRRCISGVGPVCRDRGSAQGSGSTMSLVQRTEPDGGQSWPAFRHMSSTPVAAAARRSGSTQSPWSTRNSWSWQKPHPSHRSRSAVSKAGMVSAAHERAPGGIICFGNAIDARSPRRWRWAFAKPDGLPEIGGRHDAGSAPPSQLTPLRWTARPGRPTARSSTSSPIAGGRCAADTGRQPSRARSTYHYALD